MVKSGVEIPRRRAGLSTPWVLAVVVIAVAAAAFVLWSRSKPQLDLINSGTTPLVVEFENERWTLLPNEVWHARFRAGDTLVVRESENEGAMSRTITLEENRSLTGSKPRVSAEVRWESPTGITFAYTDHQ